MDVGDLNSNARLIVSGRPIKVKGLLEHKEDLLVLMRWTTGECYVPYEIAKEYFHDMLLDYLSMTPVGIS